MPNVDKHAPGTFAWAELGTTDQNAAKQFYGTLFGWQAMDFPMGPSELYTIFQLNGRAAAAAFTLNKEMLGMGIPPHWMLYIATANAEETAAKISAAGGKVLRGPFDVMTNGRMAIAQDPAGAYFAIWEAKDHPGIGIAGEPGTLCWADLNTHHPEKATPFYEQVFGWQVTKAENDSSGYLHIKNGDEFIGGIPPLHGAPPQMPSHWLQYYLVPDCPAATAKAKELGARVYMNNVTLEKVGTFSVLSDPQGAAFALFTPTPH